MHLYCFLYNCQHVYKPAYRLTPIVPAPPRRRPAAPPPRRLRSTLRRASRPWVSHCLPLRLGMVKHTSNIQSTSQHGPKARRSTVVHTLFAGRCFFSGCDVIAGETGRYCIDLMILTHVLFSLSLEHALALTPVGSCSVYVYI